MRRSGDRPGPEASAESRVVPADTLNPTPTVAATRWAADDGARNVNSLPIGAQRSLIAISTSLSVRLVLEPPGLPNAVDVPGRPESPFVHAGSREVDTEVRVN